MALKVTLFVGFLREWGRTRSLHAGSAEDVVVVGGYRARLQSGFGLS